MQGMAYQSALHEFGRARATSYHRTMTLSLTLAIARNPHVEALLDGSVPIDGVNPQFLHVAPQIAAYRSMVRDLAYDICELAPTTYLIARDHGAPLTALPVFLMRRFHHGGLRINPAAGIREPRDLEGKQVGVRAWSVTTGVWTRAILAREFGIDCSAITWVVDDEEHVEALELPAHVEHAPEGKSLAQLMAEGDLAAAFDGNAGIGRSGDPKKGWKAENADNWPDLFANAPELEAASYRRSGIYPIHGTLVVKQALLQQYPGLAASLCSAFEAAKQQWLQRLHRGVDENASDTKYRELAKVVGPDPLPYGIEPNRNSIEALIDAAHAQGLISERLPVEEYFHAI